MKYAAEHGDVCPPLVINLAGRFIPGRASLERRFGEGILERLQRDGPIERKEPWGTWAITYDDVRERIDLPMDSYAEAIAGNQRVTLLCIHGREDAVIHYSESERCARLSGSRAVIIEGGDHNFTSPAAASAMCAEVVCFFAG